jgi:hypothetical protein
MMILCFIEHISERKVGGPVAETYILDVLIKFMIMRRVVANVSPQYNLAIILIDVQCFHYHHDVLDVILEIMNAELVVIHQLILVQVYDMKLKPVDIQVKWIIRSGFMVFHNTFN